jgi:hypothetical protein
MKTFIISCIIGACFLFLVGVTWLKWGELVTDTSRELFTPYQLLTGRVIYKDIFYPYGFLPPYIIAFLYAAFGVHINTAVSCGLAVTVIMSVLLYRISRFFMDEIFSGLTVITFLFVFAFGFYVGNGIFNYILPYSCASTLFMLSTAAGLYFFLKFIFTNDEKNLLCWAVFLSLSFFCRLDYSALTWIGFAASALILIAKSKDKNPLRALAYVLSPLLACALGYLFFLSINHAFAGFNESILNCILVNYTNKLNIAWSGMNDIATNGLKALGSFSLHIIAVSFLAICAAAIKRAYSHAKEYQNLDIMLVIIVAFFVFLLTGGYMSLFSQYRCLPLLLLTGGALSFCRVIYAADFKKDLALLTLFLISLSTIPRIFLNATPYNYGFFLLNIGLVSYYVFFVVMFGDLLSKRLGSQPDVYKAAILVFFLLLIISHWQRSSTMYGYKSLMATTERGSIACFNNIRTVRFWETVDYLSGNTSEHAKVVAFPEGASLNFFCKRDNPSRYLTFLPPDIDTVGEDRMISDLAKCRIDYIVILSRDTTEYGARAFGYDYAGKIYSWITDNYELVKQFGPIPNTSDEFGVAIFKRKGAGS